MDAVGDDHQRHFVLVHGACLGAWSWFKLIPLLEAAGHRVSAFDLAASGTDPRVIQQVTSLYEYSLPLLEFMAAIPAEEKVVLVGHSLGGINISLAMEKFPEKIAVAIFLAAFMPDTSHNPSYVLDTFLERTPAEVWLDTQFFSYDDEKDSETAALFGPKYITYKVAQLSPDEDRELWKVLVRPSSSFLKDLRSAPYFTKDGFGSVQRVFVVCDEDLSILKDFQLWMINNNPVVEVKVLKVADHMPMWSDPKQLSGYLLEVALRYA